MKLNKQGGGTGIGSITGPESDGPQRRFGDATAVGSAGVRPLSGVRLAHVTSVPFFLVTQLKNQMAHLRSYRMTVMMVSSAGPELGQLELGPGFEHTAIEIRRKPAPIQDWVALVRMIGLFRRRRFDIVHSTTPKAGFIVALAGWLMRIPVRVHTFTGQPWVTMTGPLRWVSRWSDKLIVALNTRVYADSPSQRQFLIDEKIVRAKNIRVIGGGSLAGVDVERFDPVRYSDTRREELRHEIGIRSGATVITFIGRITRDKGIRELLEATQRLRTGLVDVELILIGPIDTDIESGSDSSDNSIGVFVQSFPWVHAVGYSAVPEDFLAITDILCLPSYREGFGTVVIEAAAMGVPTVGTRITGLEDAIVDEVTGLLVPPKDIGALTGALKRLIEDAPLRHRLGQAARRRCLMQFDGRIVSSKLVDEYVSLLTHAKSGFADGPH